MSFNFNDWLNGAGQGGNNYNQTGAYSAFNDPSGTNPYPNPNAYPRSAIGAPPNPNAPADPTQLLNANAGMTPPDQTQYPIGTIINGQVPGRNSNTVVPDIHAPGMQDPSWYQQNGLNNQQYGTFSGNLGNDPTKPPDNSGDWHFQGDHWVDQTGQRDATGRYLTDAEKAYWAGHDHARAGAAQAGMSSIQSNYERANPNPGLPTGNQPSYNPYTTQPTASAAATPNVPPTAATASTAPTGPNYSNLYGGGIQGAQQGFGELNNQQFTDNSDAFKRAFGSTQGGGQGVNYNWSVYRPDGNTPAPTWDNINDPSVQQQIIAIAAANPTYDFEPTQVNGKWVLGSRARDINAQHSLLAPNTPPVSGGSSGGGGRASTSSYGKSGSGPSPNVPPTYTRTQATQGLGNASKLAGGLVGSVARAMQQQQATQQQNIQNGSNYNNSYPGETQQFGLNYGGNPNVPPVATSPQIPPTAIMGPDGRYYFGGQVPVTYRGGNGGGANGNTNMSS